MGLRTPLPFERCPDSTPEPLFYSFYVKTLIAEYGILHLNVDDFEVTPLNNVQQLGFSIINSTAFEISGDFWPKMGLI